MALRIVEWILGLPLTLIGTAQCGMAVLGLALAVVADGPMTAGMAGALFGNGLMLAVPGVLLCTTRTWAVWIVLAYGLLSLGVGLAGAFVVLLVFGGALTVLATAILVLAARSRQRPA